MHIVNNILWFVVAIGILVAFHEFGHFWVARKLGVKVLRFSVGFGKVLLSRKGKDGCEYALSAVPLGGYVKMLDEREGPVAEDELHLTFNRAPAWRRFAIVAAGPLANFLLAIAFFWLVLVIGQPGLRPVLASPPAKSAAAEAGLLEGQVITKVDGQPIATFNQLRGLLLERAISREPLRLTLQSSIAVNDVRQVTLAMDKVRVDPEFLFDDLGLKPIQPKLPPVLGTIEPNSAAAAAGFKSGDVLVSYNGVAISDWSEWVTWVRAHPGSSPKVQLERDGQPLTLSPLIATIQEAGATIGRFGVRLDVKPEDFKAYEAEEKLPPLQAIPAAVAETWRMSALTLKMFGRMFTGEVSVKNVSGPIQIAEAAGFTASIGVAAFFSFLALVSVSLGVLNLLPVPLLDGGHLVFYAYEMLVGRAVPEKVVAMGQRLGLTLLAMLMCLAFYNDLSRVFAGL